MLVDLLVERGARVRVLVHHKPYAERGHLARHRGPDSPVETLAGDVRDAGQVMDAVAGYDTVFHLAALIGIPYSYAAPEAYVRTNVAGTENVAAACRRHDVRRMVHTSTRETPALPQGTLILGLPRFGPGRPRMVVFLQQAAVDGHGERTLRQLSVLPGSGR